MPSKGIQCYTYLAVPGIEVEYSVPNQNIKRDSLQVFTLDHLEVDKKNLRTLDFSGEFSFTVRRDGRELARQAIQVNAVTGKLGDGTMKNMDQTPSIFAEDLIISYGFYDAGPGHADLPNQHQCYVTVAMNMENWMRDIAPQDHEKSERAFTRMVLPGPHDIGMNSMATSLALLKNAGTGAIKEVLGRELPSMLAIFNRVGDRAVNRIAPDIIRALAITQKDSLDTILKLGGRYFEFRPAKCHRRLQSVSALEDTWYFQHGAIPGMLYRQFLVKIVQFLVDHKDEIVVVQNRWDGVPGECPRPSEEELRGVLNDVLRDIQDLVVGDEEDMRSKSIGELRDEKKRLIVLQTAGQVSNYDDVANATLTGDSMVRKLGDMARDPPSGHAVTLLQCQATATNIRDVIVASVVDSDVSTSPILATKACCDGKILPLLRGEVGRRLAEREGLVVVMNDFMEGGTVDVAVGMCRERLG
jgi:hypothetical protein